MTQHTVIEDHLIDLLNTFKIRWCADLTWNQVFLAVNHLSQNGEIILTPTGLGAYTVAFPQQQKSRSDQRSFPS